MPVNPNYRFISEDMNKEELPPNPIDMPNIATAFSQAAASAGNIGGKPTYTTTPDFMKNIAREKLERDIFSEKQQLSEQEIDRRAKLDSIRRIQEQEKMLADEQKRAEALQDRQKMFELKQQEQELNKQKFEFLKQQSMKQKPVDEQKEKQRSFDVAYKLRNEYQKHQTTADTIKMSSAWEKAKSTFENPSPAGDMASVFNFMKLMDPGSTVREGEYANAKEAGAAADKAANYANRLMSGQLLTPEQRKDFKEITKKFYRAQLKSQRKLNDQYRKLIGNYGVSEDDIMMVDDKLEDSSEQKSNYSVGPKGRPIWTP